MLHEFLVAHKTELIKRCKMQNDQRASPKQRAVNMDYGIPLFIDQLIETLRAEREHAPITKNEESNTYKIEKSVDSELSASATKHGRELSKYEMSVDQLVHEYGDLCQEITKLAAELEAPIDVDEFRIFNRCLDNAIANAVTEYSYQKENIAASKEADIVGERLRVLANEQRHHLRTAQLSMKAIRSGNVGLNGATGAILELSLASLQRLLDRFLNGLEWVAELPSRQHVITLADFINEVKEAYPPETQVKKCKFTIRDIDKDLAVIADSDLLFMAVGKLLENSFKKVLDNSEIILSARAFGNRVLIEVARSNSDDPVKNQHQSEPYDINGGAFEARRDLDLSMCRRGIEASKGFLRLRDVPGSCELFIIDLPRHMPS